MSTHTATPDTTTALETEPKTSLSLPLHIAQRAAAALLVCAGKDDASNPMLSVAHFTGATTAATAAGDEATPRLLSTDKYKVAMVELTAADFTPPSYDDTDTELAAPAIAAFNIPRDALDWVTKITLKTLRYANRGVLADGYRIRWTASGGDSSVGADYLAAQPDTVTAELIDHDGKTERSQAFDVPRGNFPPVGRLMDAWSPATEARPMSLAPDRLAPMLSYVKKYGDATSSGPAPIEIAQGQGAHSPVMVAGAGARFILQPVLNANPVL